MHLRILVAAFLILLPQIAFADGITVGFRDVVKPDRALLSFIATLKGADQAAAKLDDGTVGPLFAPRVKTFQRSLDPFQPWKRTDDITKDFLLRAADIMVEQGDPEPGAALPNYRADALKVIAEQVSHGEPFGRLGQTPGAICAPAEYKVDRKAARRFALKYELDAYSLRFFASGVVLYERPSDDSKVLGRIPPYTLMMFDYDPQAKEPWALHEASNGIKGYLREDQPALGLAQHHVCFGKVKGEYRITALFGYGL